MHFLFVTLQGSLLDNVLYPRSVQYVLNKVLARDKVNLSASQEAIEHGEKIRLDLIVLVEEALISMGLDSLIILEREMSSKVKNNKEISIDWPKILSIGQQQLLSLTRAIFKRPVLLILDDATNYLDAESEANVYKVIFKNSIASVTIGRSTNPLAPQLFSHELKILPKEKSYTILSFSAIL